EDRTRKDAGGRALRSHGPRARRRPRARTRPVPGAERHARGGAGRAPAHRGRPVLRGRRHRFGAAALSLRLRLEHRAGRARVLQLQLRGAGRLPRARGRLHALRPGGADLHGDAPVERAAAAAGGVRKAGGDRVGRVGGGRGHHPPRRHRRGARRDRRGERGDARHPRRRFRRRESMPRHPRDHGV
ncbi:MAG: Maltose O-acetyltransferase, partial [uncultured Gemmatimonadetes bacterium]